MTTETEVRRERFDIRHEIAIIPAWAWGIATVVFFCIIFVFFVFIPLTLLES